MRKMIAVCITALMILSAQILCTAQEDSADPSKLAFLQSIGIIDDDMTERMQEDDNVTRAQAACVVARIIYKDELSNIADTGYSDVEKESYASGAIYLCKAKGIMNGVGDNEFAPDSYIANAEFTKALISALGYDAIAKKRGGYPSGYAVIAAELDIKPVGGLSENTTWKALVSMVCDALDAPVLKSDYSGDGYEYKSGEDKTVLSEYYDIYKNKGIITDDGNTSLTGKSEVTNNEVVITLTDSSSYGYLKGSVDVEGLLGRRVEYYFKEESSDSKTLCYVTPYNNKELTINAEDIKGFSSNSYKYYDENDKERNVNIENTADVIYNNSAYLPTDTDEMIPKDGYITLVDNNNDGVYDVVFIYDVVTMMVKSTYESSDMYSILGMYDESFRFDPKSITLKTYIDGKKASFSDVIKYQTASVAISRDSAPDTIVTIYVSDQYVDGKIDSTSEDNWVIDGKSYDLSYCFKNNKQYYEDTLNTLKYDTVQTVRLDVTGKISGIEEDILNPDDYVFIMSAVYEDADETLNFKIYTSKGKFKVLQMRDGININGKRYTTAKAAMTRLLDGRAQFSPQVAVINQNDDGAITGLNIAGEQMGETKSIREDYKDVSVAYKKTNKIFSGLFAANENSIIFAVNPDDYSDESNYAVYTPADINDTTYTACAYDVKDNGTAKAILLKTGVTEMTIENDVYMAVVSKITTELDSNDEPRKKIYYYQKGILGSAFIDKKYEEQLTADKQLTKGDAFRFYLDPQTKEITTIMRHLDFENRDSMITESSAVSALQTDYNYLLRFVYGTVIERSGSIIKIRIKRDSEPNGYVDRIFSMSRSNIMIYDESRKLNNVQQGKASDIKDYASIGDMNSASRVFMRQRYGEVLDTIVYQP